MMHDKTVTNLKASREVIKKIPNKLNEDYAQYCMMIFDIFILVGIYFLKIYKPSEAAVLTISPSSIPGRFLTTFEMPLA